MNELEKSLAGETILSTEWNEGGVTFVTDKGPVEWEVDADCCSNTWIEHADFELCRGKVLKVEDAELPREWYVKHPGPEEQDHLQTYGITIQTEAGTGTIDFRNESNGYYGGSLVVKR